MFAEKNTSRSLALLTMTILFMACILTTGAAAADRETLYNTQYCFSESDFVSNDAALTGIFVTDVPSATVGKVCYGTRVIRPGDVLPLETLGSLSLSPVCQSDREATLCYLPITENGLGQAQTVTIGITSGKNNPPIATGQTLQTYKNIANTGVLGVTDAENDQLTYSLTTAPKRGTVEIADDGTFTYTPNKNKVGKDSFAFTATDAAGNTSNEATVQIEILKPIDKLTYGDMHDDPNQFTALWMRSEGLFTGETIGGVTCFGPEKAVSRGEFLVMVSQLTGLKPDDAEQTSGFADEASTPHWMQPYIVSALRAGVISGLSSDEGLVFRPSADLTTAEASVILQNALKLPAAKKAAAFPADAAVPTWAESAVSALSEAGVPVDYAGCLDAITRRDAANLLYAVSQLNDTGSVDIKNLF